MKWTQVNELGIAGRFLMSMFIGCAAVAIFMALALLGVTLFPPSVWSFAFAVPLMPGLALLFLLSLHPNDVVALVGFNIGLYGLAVFGIWQRMVAKRLRRKQ